MDEKIGMCSKCHEWTSLEESCCGAPIWIEGSLESPEDEEDLDLEKKPA